jgi:hypothetical protein
VGFQSSVWKDFTSYSLAKARCCLQYKLSLPSIHNAQDTSTVTGFNCRSQDPQALACLDCGFEFRQGHEYLSLVTGVACFYVYVSTTGQSLDRMSYRVWCVSVLLKNLTDEAYAHYGFRVMKKKTILINLIWNFRYWITRYFLSAEICPSILHLQPTAICSLPLSNCCHIFRQRAKR